MRFLADESCDFGVVRGLRSAGHDVTAMAELSPRSPDPVVLEMALREERILLTEDKDFGQLVYSRQMQAGGVILLRFPATARSSLSQAVVDLVERYGRRLTGRFVVVQPGRARIGGEP